MSDPIPFRAPQDIPILGQACKVHGWFPTVLLQCQCDAKTPLMIVGLGAVAACEVCRRHFTIGALNHDPMSGAGTVQVVQVPAPSRGPVQ